MRGWGRGSGGVAKRLKRLTGKTHNGTGSRVRIYHDYNDYRAAEKEREKERSYVCAVVVTWSCSRGDPLNCSSARALTGYLFDLMRRHQGDAKMAACERLRY